MNLSLYKRKRNFKNTREPVAQKGNKKSSFSFVVQRHAASHLHYDFRLEMHGALKSWAVPKGPSMKAGEKRLAVMVEDHPLAYGKFRGEIPKGNYGAGTVEIWDRGKYQPLENGKNKDPEKVLLEQLKKGDLKFKLNGTHLKGAFALVRMHNGEGKNWLLIKKDDEYAVKDFSIEKEKPLKPYLKKTNSSSQTETTKRTTKKESGNAEHAWKHLNRPMLAKLTSEVKDNVDWLYETKYDGYRAITKIRNDSVEMISRNGNSFNKQYSPLIKELEEIKDDVVLDGEVVIENKKGIGEFQLLQNYSRTKQGVLKYYVFDILFLNGHSLQDMTLRHRKELLEVFFQKYKFKNIIQSPVTVGKGKELFKKLSSKGYEGIIAKDMESTYQPGRRSGSWLKVKSVMMQEVVICGYTLPQKSRKYFGSIILGINEGRKLKFIGNCGTGFTDASLKELHEQFEKLKTDKCPFDEKPTLTGTKRKPVWIIPKLICNVKFLEWTQDKRLRNPVFMGLRTDKEANEVIKENSVTTDPINIEKEKIIKFGNKKVVCTNLTKVYWPDEGITKGDLIAYYQSIAKYILPYLKNRPESLNRHPNGIAGASFYQKDMNVNQLPSWVKTVRLYSKSNKKYIDYLVCNDVATLAYMANLGCIEINPWHSTYSHPDYPDYVILDLDPGDITFVDVVNTALVIKEICDESGINCFCKTSGATGLHIYIPMGGKYTYDEVKTFAELLATVAHQRLPHTTSVERPLAKRKDKIYLDFLQNRKGQTIAAPYSVRPKPHATVSTPLLWKEVNHKLTPEMFTIHNIEKRLNKVGDLWKGVLGKPITLEKALRNIDKL